MNSDNLKSILTGVLCTGAGALAGYTLGRSNTPGQQLQKPAIEITVQDSYRVNRVIDGDTIDIEEGVEVLLKRIRLLGIDTPERGKPLYREATKALEELIRGNKIKLEKDPSADLGKYGRPLRYIICDGQNINVEMVRLGYARLLMHKGLKYEKELLAAQEEAQEAKKGIWSVK